MLPRRSSKLIPMATARRAPRGATLGLASRGTAVAAVRGEADRIAVLITRYFLYDWNDPQQPNNDHLIFSKGHASPLLYAIFKAVGVITDDEMLTFRKFGSRLQGHPTPALPWVDVATGSLGQG